MGCLLPRRRSVERRVRRRVNTSVQVLPHAAREHVCRLDEGVFCIQVGETERGASVGQVSSFSGQDRLRHGNVAKVSSRVLPAKTGGPLLAGTVPWDGVTDEPRETVGRCSRGLRNGLCLNLCLPSSKLSVCQVEPGLRAGTSCRAVEKHS